MATATTLPAPCGNDDDPADYGLCRCCGSRPLAHPFDAVCPACEADYPGYCASPTDAAEVA